MSDIKAILDAADSGLEQSLERLFDLVRIPSISTDPAYKAQCRQAAERIVADLSRLGFSASVRDTPGHPMVVAHFEPRGAAGKVPHFLFYGHYDVQPPDPLDKWTTPPFAPEKRTGKDGVVRLYGRGTADDKGQLMTFIEAMRAWIETTGSLPVEVTILIEGEEESGSPSLIPFLKENKAELSCDAAFVCDTGMWDARTPAVTTRLRGMVKDEITITGPRIDLHSGAYGGPAANPIRILARLLSKLHDKNGKVTVPGFYDGVGELPRDVRQQWRKLKFSDRKFLKEVGLSVPAGEKGRGVLEQIWARPTAEVNGIWGGYMGAGTKTVIPSQAHAKLTFRLVGKQNPRKILKAFRAFARAEVPKDCKIDFAAYGAGSPASEIAETSPLIRKAARALKDEWGRETALVGSGGSIPIVRYFKDVLGMDSVLIGFGLNDDALHSPNEKYNLSSFHKGIRSWVRVLGELAR
ncbi:MAG: M20/M25/M40 family metallo-hydrolase [Parvibaculaceae bacterium]